MSNIQDTLNDERMRWNANKDVLQRLEHDVILLKSKGKSVKDLKQEYEALKASNLPDDCTEIEQEVHEKRKIRMKEQVTTFFLILGNIFAGIRRPPLRWTKNLGGRKKIGR